MTSGKPKAGFILGEKYHLQAVQLLEEFPD